MAKTISAIIFLAGITLCFAQAGIRVGSCRDAIRDAVIQNFDADAYLGFWYEIERYDNTFQGDGECTTAWYQQNPDGTIRVQNSQINPGNPSTNYTEVGRAELCDPQDPLNRGRLKVSFPGQPSTGCNYKVLSTDYTSYTLVWNCIQLTSLPPTKLEFLWLLSRTPTIQARAPIVEQYYDQWFVREDIRPTNHSGCPNHYNFGQ